ncbi:hypothetical protein Moror_6462 [Moniliophthora roreri MCA 2997]|uniref:Uncharacterized protein n=1 Tax=Moniliophthora roreri (strain MCA 2997) TaxID=1381753 RepID=V2YYV5_MONRO|nr:hypothetical protein Moror_6462 [Moniliophthora roreri MCA 2997]
MSVFYGAAYYTHLLTEQEPYDVMYKRVLCDDTRKASKMYKQLGTLTAILPYIILATASVCPGQVDLGESTIGANNEVKVGFATCPDTSPELLAARDTFLDTRQTPPANVCGAPCNTNCFTPAGGGPDPNDCHVIADALLFAFQNTAPLFVVGTGTNNTIVMTYRSCQTFFVNQATSVNLEYCRSDWAAVLDWVAFNCQATQNAHGGNCVATDQRWFIQ